MGKRLVLGLFVLVGVLSSVSAARADIPQIVVPGKGHRYVVWLDPAIQDGTKPPLTPEDQLRYCSAAEGFARRIWKTTNGRHRIFQVEFNYGTAPLRYDVYWRRYHSVANASGGIGGGRFDMFDGTTLGTHTWFEKNDGTPGISVACPAGLTVHDTGFPNRETCVDANGVSPLESPQAYAATMAHEASHSHYALFDEYATVAPPQFPDLYGARICENPEWHTSMMASPHEDVWCDENTHLNHRFLASPFSGRFEVRFPVPQPDAWTLAKGFWSDLGGYNPGPKFTQGPGVVPQNEYFTNPVGEWAPLPTEPFCVFTGSEFPAAILNDLVVVVDKSGSMGYRTTPLDQTAFQAAFSAGLGHYNRTPPQRKSGLSVFDSVVTRTIPYSLRGSEIHSASEFNLAAGGNTNLCSAISDAAAQVRTGGTSDAAGHMVLLTDGRPTVPGCNTAAAVRDAAMQACQPSDGSKPVGISAVAFGDADFALIQQISDICGGVSRFVDDSGPDACSSVPRAAGSAAACPGPGPQPAPINIKVASARLAYQVRDYREAMFVQDAKPLVFEKSFDVPPGTTELEAVWMGELVEFIDEAGQSFCRFDRHYVFELVDPAGNLAGFDPVTPAVELQYLTRTRRVTEPAAGRWTMRVTGGFPCVTDNEFHAPSVAMFAMYRNHAVRGHLTLDKKKIKANEVLRVTALLETGPNTVAGSIEVAARLVNGPLQVPLPMFDDGVNGGDEVAGDGRYSALLNPSCSPTALLPGSYRVVVEYQSDAATAQSLLFPDPDVLLHASPLLVSPPVSASLVEEQTLVVEGCNARFPGCPGVEAQENVCPETGVLVGGGISIVPGTKVRDVTVDVQNCPIGTTGVGVGAGPGVRVSKVRSSYDDALGKGSVTFDLTAAANAPNREQPISVFWGRQRCDTIGCPGDTTPPVITPTASVVDVCRPKPQVVQVPLPAITDNCTARTPRLTGEVIAIRGRALQTPIPIVNGQARLPLGTHTVRWRSEDSEGNVATLDQQLEVRFRQSANCCKAGPGADPGR